MVHDCKHVISPWIRVSHYPPSQCRKWTMPHGSNMWVRFCWSEYVKKKSNCNIRQCFVLTWRSRDTSTRPTVCHIRISCRAFRRLFIEPWSSKFIRKSDPSICLSREDTSNLTTYLTARTHWIIIISNIFTQQWYRGASHETTWISAIDKWLCTDLSA